MEPQKNKIHRIRISDEEIQVIALALNTLAEIRKKDGADYREVSKLRFIASRFSSWGTEYFNTDRPYYARPRR